MTSTRGTTLLETLLAATVGVLVLSALTGALAAGGRALVRSGARAEAADTMALATDAFVFDVRHAGHDPAAAGIDALADARVDRLTVEADLDGDGSIAPNSAERVTWVCNAGARRLSRIVGAQSLPLADRVTRCGLGYLDAAATTMTPPPGGLDAATRARVALVSLDLALLPRGGGPPVARAIGVALRSQP